jgi:tetratricopeptide (TPR) repeat protein
MIAMIPSNALKSIFSPLWLCSFTGDRRTFATLLSLIISVSVLVYSPTFADPILDEAASLLKSGRAEAAEAVYQKYLKMTPTSLPARLALAEIAMRKADFAAAQGLLENALANNPGSADVAALLGRLFIQQYDISTSITSDSSDKSALNRADTVLKQARDLDPENPTILTQSAEWSLRQGDMASAERDFQHALKRNPTYVPAFQGLIRFHIQTKDIRRANDTAMHTLDLDPNNSLTHFLIARMLGIANHPAEAVKYALKSEQLDYGRLPERDAFLAAQYDKLGESEQALRYYQARLSKAPLDTGGWLRTGKISDRVAQGELDTHEIKAYKEAVSVRPTVLAGLQTQARENSRAERIETALGQWRQILAIPGDELAAEEARGAIAGLRLLQRQVHPDQPMPDVERDVKALQALPDDASPISKARNELDRTKLNLAIQTEMSPEVKQSLSSLAENADSAIAGEASFILNRMDRVQTRLDEVDGLSPDEYTTLADRLLLDGELSFSQVFYQRAFEITRDAGLTAAMNHIKARQSQAQAKVNEGNVFFNARNYPEAINKYCEAVALHRQSDSIYLRLGDTYEKLHQWPEAYQAYQTAQSLSPGLANSPGFSRQLNRLADKAKVPKKPTSTPANSQ